MTISGLEARLKRISAAWFYALLLGVIGVVYAPVIRELVRDWIHDPNYSHSFLIPLVAIFLIQRDRQRLKELPRNPSNAGLIGILIAACLLILGAAAAEVFTQRVSLIFLLGSCVYFLLGRAWARSMAFPIGFQLLAIPLPYVLYYGLTSPLQALSARCAVLGLRVIGVPVMAEGNVLHLQSTSLEVAEACSGIRSLYSFLAIGALMAYSMKGPMWARLGVLLLTIPLTIFANAFRVWASAVGAQLIGPQVTRGTIHELFGLLVFATALAFLLLIRKGVRDRWSSVP